MMGVNIGNQREGEMEEIIKDLKEIRDKIESWDDPTAPTLYRDRLTAMHDCVEECIQGIEDI